MIFCLAILNTDAIDPGEEMSSKAGLVACRFGKEWGIDGGAR